MKNNKLSALCFVLTAFFMFSACSPVRIAKVEKRRYQRGYYVQMNHQVPNKKAAKVETESSVVTNEFAKVEQRRMASENRMHVRKEIKNVKTAIKKFKQEENLKQFMATANGLANNVAILDTRKNLASIPSVKVQTPGAASFHPKGSSILGTGVSAVVLLVIFLVVFLILIDPIIAILMAVLLALLIIWILRALDVID